MATLLDLIEILLDQGHEDLATEIVLSVLNNGADEVNPAGFKRPLEDFHGKRLPVPWVTGTGPSLGQWKKIDGDRAREVEEDLLCLVCGEPRGENWVYGNLQFSGMRSMGHSKRAVSSVDTFMGRPPSATFGHPKCILTAAINCPHLQAQTHPASLPDGTLLTVEDLRKLIHEERTDA